MKGYLNGNGYMGFVNGRYILFASEAEYEEYMMEDWSYGEGNQLASRDRCSSVYEHAGDRLSFKGCKGIEKKAAA